MQVENGDMKEDGDEPDFVDSFFLPGGILEEDEPTPPATSFLLPSFAPAVSDNPWSQENDVLERRRDDSPSWRGAQDSPPQVPNNEVYYSPVKQPASLSTSLAEEGSAAPANPSRSSPSESALQSIVKPPPGFDSIQPILEKEEITSTKTEETYEERVLTGSKEIVCPTEFQTEVSRLAEEDSNQTGSVSISSNGFDIQRKASTPLQMKRQGTGRTLIESKLTSANTNHENKQFSTALQQNDASLRTCEDSVPVNGQTTNDKSPDPTKSIATALVHPPSDEASTTAKNNASDDRLSDRAFGESKKIEPLNDTAGEQQRHSPRSKSPSDSQPVVRFRQEKRQGDRKAKSASSNDTAKPDERGFESEKNETRKRKRWEVYSYFLRASTEVCAILTPFVSLVMLIAKWTMLFGRAALNIYKYASREAWHEDSAIWCYMVLLCTPSLCEWTMLLTTLPHYSVHVISAAAIFSIGTYQRATTDRTADKVCIWVLRAVRHCLPIVFLYEASVWPLPEVMMLDTGVRLIIAYVLSLLRSGFILSPVGWISWAIQVLVVSLLPHVFISSLFLFHMGLATIQLIAELQTE